MCWRPGKSGCAGRLNFRRKPEADIFDLTITKFNIFPKIIEKYVDGMNLECYDTPEVIHQEFQQRLRFLS